MNKTISLKLVYY